MAELNPINYHLAYIYNCSDAAGEKLRKVFRNPDGAKVYEVFLKHWRLMPSGQLVTVAHEWTAKELQEEAGVGEATVFRMLSILEELDLIESVGKAAKQLHKGGPRSRLWKLKGMEADYGH